MEIKVKPIKGQKTQLSKLFEELVLKELPIHQWEAKQKQLKGKL